MARIATVKRTTKETDIELTLNLDGEGKVEINTGIGFFDHMLTLFGKHGNFDLSVYCKGDIEVDFHHSVEDVGIALGQAFKIALGDKAGITRYGDKAIPMDETLVLSAVDFSGRSALNCDIFFPSEKIGDFDTELIEEFYAAFTRSAELALHVVLLAGENSHHIAECSFKSVARSLREAVEIDLKNVGKIPSTKGVL